MNEWLHRTGSALGDHDAWHLFLRVLQIASLDEVWHYFVIALLLSLLVHVALRKRLEHRRIGKWSTWHDVRHDIPYSISTAVHFGALNALLLALQIDGQAHMYIAPLDHGLPWLVASLPLLLLWQDTHFYWTHRMMHSRWIFKHIHRVHHHTRHPSPWTSYAFHPLEALNNMAMITVAVVAVPLNETVLAIFLVHQILRNALGHAEVEMMPPGFVRHRVWGLFTTTTHHHMHHEYGAGNYGLWFTWWDRWCKTERADYVQRFDRATSKQIGEGGDELSLIGK